MSRQKKPMGNSERMLGSPRLLVGKLGTRSDRGVPRQEPLGRLSPADLYDARRRHRDCESGDDLPSPQGCWMPRPISVGAQQEGNRLCPAGRPALSLAHRCQPREPWRHLLLPDHGARRLQPLHRPLGNSGTLQGIGYRNRVTTGLGKMSHRQTSGHQ